MQEVAGRRDAVGADAGEVALDDVLLAAVVDFDAGAVEPDDVARPGEVAADDVVVAAGDLDAEEVVALCGAESGGGLGAVADGADAVGGDADEVALDGIAARRVGEAADDVDPVDRIAGGDVALRRAGAADR